MITVIRHIRDRHPVRRYMIRTAGRLAIAFFIIGVLIVLSGCACPTTEAYCGEPFPSGAPRQ